MTELAIIGGGKVGRALGRLARAAGYRIGPVVCRSRAHAEEAVAFIGGGRAGTEPAGAELTLVSVPDGAIGAVARELRAPRGAVVAHTCGWLGREILRPHRPAGAVHPLRSFGDPARAAELFEGTACAVEGDPAAVRELVAFVRAVGGRPLRVRAGRKALYHAGAVFASNYVAAVLGAGLRLFEGAGLGREEARRAVKDLAEGTLANVASVGLPAALTGPVERGDAGTVRAHAEALAEGAPGLSEAYAVLGRLAVGMALEKGTIGPAGARRVRAALGGRGGASRA